MKFITIFLAFFTALIITPCHADNYIPYLNLTNKAEWLYDQREYAESKRIFEEAFQLVEKIKYKDMLIYSKILSQQNEQKKIYRFLKKHLKQIGGLTFPISSDLKRVGIPLSDKRMKKLDKFLDTTSASYHTELELSKQFEKLCDLAWLIHVVPLELIE